MTIPKPLLKGLFYRELKRNIFVSCVAGCIGALIFHNTVSQPRKKAYADFYATYDAEKDFHRMRKLGIFQHVSPDDDDTY